MSYQRIEKRKSNKLPIFLLLLLLVGIGIFGVWYYLNAPKDDTSQNNVVVDSESVKYIIGESKEKGILQLYDYNDGKKASEIDLSLLFENTKEIVEVEKTRKVKVAKNKDIKTLALEGDYEVVEQQIKKGDTIWDIQKVYTPELNDQQIVALLFRLAKENNGEKLHPVYPGDKRIFLRPINFVDKDANTEMVEIEEKYMVKEEREIPRENFEIIYNKNKINNGKLYAYLTNDKHLIEITIKKGKFETNSVLKNLPFKNVQQLHTYKDEIVILHDDSKKISTINVLENRMVNSIDVPIAVTWVEIKDNYIAYAFNTKIYVYNTLTGETKENDLGEAIQQPKIFNNSIYLYTNFANEVNNSVYMQLDLKELTITSIEELKAKHNYVMSVDEDIIVSQHSEEEGKNNTIKNQFYIATLAGKKVRLLTRDSNVDKIYKNSVLTNQQIFIMEDGKLNVYPLEKPKEINRDFPLESERFFLVK